MARLIAYLCITVVFCTMCKKQIVKDDTIDISLLNDGNYILKVDRVSHGPDVQFPRDSLNESYYTVTDEHIQYEITISEYGHMILIKPGLVSGERIKDGELSKSYVLSNGLFAGGRFIIWINNNIFEAEYTIYGSGIPIIKSERGRFKLQER